MKARSAITLFLVVCSAAFASAATTQMGDITAAVRAAGGSVSVSAPGDSVTDLVNGKFNDRYMSVADDMSPVTIDFDFGTSFLPGEDIVVTGLTFAVCGSSPTAFWGNYDKRMPKSWTLSGSNDGTTWTTISVVNGFAGYVNGTLGGYNSYLGSVSFTNWKSFRKYRLYVSENTGNATYYLQITEVLFSGFYGGTVVQPEPVLIDVSKAVRDAGQQTAQSNAGTAASSLDVGCAFNGVYGKSDRYLSNADTTKALLDAGQTINIDYSVGAGYDSQADVIVTGYAIDVDQSFADPKARLPKSWLFQGSNDGVAWTTLDSVRGFGAWETKQVVDESSKVEKPHYAYTFRFVNPNSYRHYRFAVSELYDRSKSGNMIQVSEIQLFGYVDVEIAGKVGKSMTGMPFNMTVHETTGAYAANVTISQFDDTPNTYVGKVADLFDGTYGTEMLLRMGTDADELAYAPIVIGYEMGAQALEGKDVVLRSYKFAAKSTAGQYDRRLPRDWRLEGYIGGQWRRIDSRKNFSDWTVDTDLNVCYAEFELPNNIYSCRNYRILVSEVSGLSQHETHNAMHQLRLCEIEMSGEWGTGIAKPWEPKGSFILVW